MPLTFDKKCAPGSVLFYTGYGTKALIYESTNILGIDTVEGVKCVRVNSMRTEKK